MALKACDDSEEQQEEEEEEEEEREEGRRGKVEEGEEGREEKEEKDREGAKDCGEEEMTCCWRSKPRCWILAVVCVALPPRILPHTLG